MPARLLKRVKDEGAFCRIYNIGLENKTIFKDAEDYETFENFLEEYLTTPQDAESIKKTFTVKGKTFRGIPHQPKNYAGDVDLLAFRLLPDRFDLLLHQKNKNSLERFMRSLTTRYSIYYNKKYQRKGVVFEGPYKSIHIDDKSDLLALTRLFHRKTSYSSFPEYVDERKTPWVKPDAVLDVFNEEKDGSLKEFTDYKDFVEKYEQAEPEGEILTPNRVPARPQTFPFAEMLTATSIFLLLTGLGLRNINVVTAKNVADSKAQSNVLSESTALTPTPSPENLIKLVVKITDGVESVNIREGTSTKTPIIGKAKEGQIFMGQPASQRWYEVKLENGSNGYISSKYIEIYKSSN